MARNNLTSNDRGFGKNPRSFVLDPTASPIAVTLSDGTTTTTVVVNPRSLEVSGPNGETVNATARHFSAENKIDNN